MGCRNRSASTLVRMVVVSVALLLLVWMPVTTAAAVPVSIPLPAVVQRVVVKGPAADSVASARKSPKGSPQSPDFDYPPDCFQKLERADQDEDGQIDSKEFLEFSHLLGLPNDIDESPLSLSSRFNYLACLCHEIGDTDDDCCSGDNAHVDLKEARKDEVLLYYICRLTETAVEEYYPSASPSRGFFLAPFTIPSLWMVDTLIPTNAPQTPNPTQPSDDTFSPSNAPTKIQWMPWGPISLPTTDPSAAPSLPPSIAPSTSPSIVASTEPSTTTTSTPSVAESIPPSIATSNVPSIPPSTTPSIATSTTPSILPSITTSIPSITFGPIAIPTITTTTSPEPWTPSSSPSTSEVETSMRIALRKTQEWNVAYRTEIVQALSLLKESLQQQRLQQQQQQSLRRWLQQQDSTDANPQTAAQIVNETTVSCPSSITLTHECRDVTVRVPVPIGSTTSTIEDATMAINNAIDDGSLQRLIQEINPNSTMTVLGVVPTEQTTPTPTLSPSPSKQPEKGDGTATPSSSNNTANSDPFIDGGTSDSGGMSSVAIGAMVLLGTAMFLIGVAIVVGIVRHSYRQKQDREAAAAAPPPLSIIHTGRGAFLSDDDDDDDEEMMMMDLNDGDVEMGGTSEESRARRRRHQQLQQRANKYRSVSSGSDSFVDPLDPYLYSTSAHTADSGEMYPGTYDVESRNKLWHNGKTNDTETTSESTPLYVDSSIDASQYEENMYDKSLAVGVAVGVIAGDRFNQWEDTGNPSNTSFMERNGDAPKEWVMASETAQFNPNADHSDGSDLSTDSADVWTKRNLSSPEQLVQASETAQFDPTADHSKDILPKGLAAAIAVSNGMDSDANSDTTTDSSSDDESSSSAGDSTSSSSSSGSSSTEDLATGITNYDPKTAEIAISSATMIGVVVGLSKNEDERFDSDEEWDTSETNAEAASSNGAPSATLITSHAVDSRNASASKSIPESTRSPQQKPAVELLSAVATAQGAPLASFSDSESSYDEGQTSDNEEGFADIIVASNVQAASPITDVNATNTTFVLRPGERPREQGTWESNAIGVGDQSMKATTAASTASSEIQIASPDRDASLSGETESNDTMMFLAAPVVAGTFSFDDASSSGTSEGNSSIVRKHRNPLPGAAIATRGISGDAVSSDSANEESSAPSMAPPAGAAVAGTSFRDKASSSNASEGGSTITKADPNTFSGAVMTATGIVGDLPSTDSDSEGSSTPSTTSPAAAAADGTSFGGDASSRSANADPNALPGAVITTTGIVGDLPSTYRDSDRSLMPSITSPAAAALAPTSVRDDASSSSDASSASEWDSSSANPESNPLPGVVVTGIIGDSPSTDSDSESDSELDPAPFPHHDSVSDFNSRQSLSASLIDLNGCRDLSMAPLPIEDSVSDFSTRQNLQASSEIMCAPMPATDSFSDLQTRQPTSALSRASAQHSMSTMPFEESGEGSKTSFVAFSGSKLQDASHQPDSSLHRFQQRRSQRLSAFSSSMRANSVARRKSIADPALSRSYDRNDLRSSMPPPTLSGVFDVRMRSLHEHPDQDDESDSSYFDSVVGSMDDITTTDEGKTASIQGAREVAAFESALGRFSTQPGAMVANDAMAADPNQLKGGHGKATLLSHQRLAEEDIWGSIADASALDHDQSDAIMVWALSRSMSRLAAADQMGELSLPPGIVQVSSSSSDGGEPTYNDNDLSSIGTPISSSSSSASLDSDVER